jgi:hypothetical protein
MINYEVKQILFNKEIIEYISKGHYTRSCPSSVKYAFGLFDSERMIGVCLYGDFSRLQSRNKYQNCLELSRLFIEEGAMKNSASFFIGKTLKWLKANTVLSGVVSYADTTEGHTGAIYKASNFQTIGTTKNSYHYLNRENERIHKRQVWERARTNGVTEKMQASTEGLICIKELSKFIFYYTFDGTDIGNLNVNNYRLKFFKKWTRESAWVYGLILGDGCIVGGDDNRTVQFAGNKDTVEKFEKLLKIENKNRYSSGIYHTAIHSKDVNEWFQGRGYSGKKSHSLIWPEDIPEEFMWDFVRGLIDTDGSWPKINSNDECTQKGKPKIMLTYSSATKDFVEKFAKFLNLDSGAKESFKEMNGKKYFIYSLSCSDFEKTIELGLKIYDCPPNIRNEQKYQDFKYGLTLHSNYQKGCIICGDKLKTAEYCTKHFYEIRKKEQLPTRCFCGDESYVIKLGLCSTHYNRYIRRRKVNPHLSLEEFKTNKDISDSSEEILAKVEDRFEKFDENKSMVVFYEGHKFLIDKEDYDLFQDNKWAIDESNTLLKKIGSSKYIFKRAITNAPNGRFVVHKNMNSFDCRKENLLILTNSEMVSYRKLGSCRKEDKQILGHNETEPDAFWEEAGLNNSKPKCKFCSEGSLWKGLCYSHYMKEYRREKNGGTLRERRTPISSDAKTEICIACNKNKSAIGNLCRGCWNESKGLTRYKKDNQDDYKENKRLVMARKTSEIEKEKKTIGEHNRNTREEQNKTINSSEGYFLLNDEKIYFDIESLPLVVSCLWRRAKGLLLNRIVGKINFLWRLILDDHDSFSVKFKDGDINNYRKENLIPITKEEQCSLASLNKKGKTRGIRLHKKTNTFLAEIGYKGQMFCLGYFKTYEEAVRARNIADIHLGSGRLFHKETKEGHFGKLKEYYVFEKEYFRSLLPKE